MDNERAELTEEDFVAAGVESPRRREGPIPSLETWRKWRAAEGTAIAHKHVLQRTSES